MSEDPFDTGRPNRDSHTVRLAYKRAEQRPAPRFPAWLGRVLAAVGLVAVVIWFALPAPVPRQFPQRAAVQFWHQWTGERREKIEALVADFNRSQERYEVIPLSVPGQTAEQKVLLAIAGGQPPDVLSMYGSTVGTWAADGLLQPLDGLLSAEDHRVLREDGFAVGLKAARCNGQLYGIPIGMHAYACYFRVDAIRAAGLDPDRLPSSLEELVEWGRTLDRFDSQGRLQRVGFLPTRMAVFAPLFAGGFSERPDGSLTIDIEGNRRALAFIGDAYRHYGHHRLVQFRSSFNTSSLSTEWPFISGLNPITIDGQFRMQLLADYAPDVEYRTAPVPPPTGGRAHAGFASVTLAHIPVGAQEPQGAMAFIRYWSGLHDPQIAGAFNADALWLPPLRTALASPHFQDYLARHPQLRTFINVIDNPEVESLPPVSYQNYFNIRMWRAEESVARGGKTPEQALQDLAAEMDKERGRRGRLSGMGGVR